MDDAFKIIPKLKNETNKLRTEIQLKDSENEGQTKEVDMLANLN